MKSLLNPLRLTTLPACEWEFPFHLFATDYHLSPRDDVYHIIRISSERQICLRVWKYPPNQIHMDVRRSSGGVNLIPKTMFMS